MDWLQLTMEFPSSFMIFFFSDQRTTEVKWLGQGHTGLKCWLELGSEIMSDQFCNPHM